MCTVTFVPRRGGYILGMNRDEKLTRVIALTPVRHRMGGRDVVFPSEPGGGTWIGLNDAGASLALINWYAIPACATGKPLSRGEVVKALLTSDARELADKRLSGLPLKRLNPFRLIGVFPKSKKVFEWRWNREQLECGEHPWESNTWISSGFDERGAQKTRNKVFSQALLQETTGSLGWLRRLHGSHEPARGPYSTCMHREDAATVSYTEVVVERSQAIMRYRKGAPCCGMPASVHRLALSR
jgi:hypothetical protein